MIFNAGADASDGVLDGGFFCCADTLTTATASIRALMTTRADRAIFYSLSAFRFLTALAARSVLARNIPVRTFALRADFRFLCARLSWNPCMFAPFALIAL